ncbi:MAG: DUF309 domain-containing protein [Planctomycetota bacterium]
MTRDAPPDDVNRPKRYSDRPLPPYSHVPGLTPHPVSDPRGHMHGQEEEEPSALEPEAWEQSPTFLYAIDLFNYGYYWEAHEAWEQLWIAAGRAGGAADFLKGLIKLAAAGVKLREGNSEGVLRHGKRAEQLLAAGAMCGLDHETLLSHAASTQALSGEVPDGRDADRALPIALEPKNVTEP